MRSRIGVGALWAGAALLTRLPLAGRSPGEADGARYVIGVLQWARWGRGAPWIYAKVLSPGYYALAGWAFRHIPLSPQAGLSGLSVAAAAISAPLLYFTARRWLAAPPAAAATLLYLLAPAFWWLGIEPHPQGVAFACLLLAMETFWRGEAGSPARTWQVAAAAALTAALLCKADVVLVWGGWAVLTAQRWGRQALARLGGVWMAAAAAFALLRVRLLGESYAQTQHLTLKALAEFAAIPRGGAWLQQLLPVACAAGLGVSAAIGTAFALGWRDAAWRRAWLAPAAAWALPGGIFWLLLRGNNARHMAPLLLLPLWAAADWAARHLTARHLAIAAACCLALDAGLPPSSSNLTLYPAGNVVASQGMLRARLRTAQSIARAAQAAPGACFAGDYTLPYFELAQLEADPGARLEDGATAFIGRTRFFEVENGAAYRAARLACPRMLSLEYDPAGRRVRFLGAEWSWLPGAAHFWPGHLATAEWTTLPPLR